MAQEEIGAAANPLSVASGPDRSTQPNSSQEDIFLNDSPHTPAWSK